MSRTPDQHFGEADAALIYYHRAIMPCLDISDYMLSFRAVHFSSVNTWPLAFTAIVTFTTLPPRSWRYYHRA